MPAAVAKSEGSESTSALRASSSSRGETGSRRSVSTSAIMAASASRVWAALMLPTTRLAPPSLRASARA